MDEEEGQWRNLSNDVLALILKRLNTQADLCRFRSICKSWRSFANSSNPHLIFPLSLPSLHPNSRPFSLSPSLLYLLSPPPHNHHHVWLVKVSETGHNSWAILNPLTKHKLYLPSGVLQKQINLLGFRNLEVGRSYKLQLIGSDDAVDNENTFDFEEFSSSITLRKVVVQIGDEFSVLALYGYGQIAIWKLGDEKWKFIETGESEFEKQKKNPHFDDVICYDDRFYAIDRRGRMVTIDPKSSELSEVVSPMEENDCNFQYTYLVESSFRLYLVIKIVNPRPVNYYDEEEEEWVVDKTTVGKPIGFKVFVFNEREKGWERVWSLRDRVFFVSRDAAFSVCAEDLGWSKGNCVYFEGLTGYDDEADMGFGLNAGVYSLEDDVITIFSSLSDPLARIFYPPSSWFVPRESHADCEMQD